MDHVFHRNFNYSYPLIERGEGVYLIDDKGKKYLDGAAGAISVSLGYSNQEVIEAIYEQAKKVPFVHTMRFETDILHRCCSKIAQWAPETLNYVYLTSGGSEAVESSIKLAKQYHVLNGNEQKNIVIGRWQGYHGNTLGALSAGGDSKRRAIYLDLLPSFEHIHPPYCHRCPYNKNYEHCQIEKLECVNHLEKTITEIGPEKIAAFIAEPIVGSQIAALIPPEEYWQQVSDICKKYDIILIADEVMTGIGRTGTAFAVEHWGVIPDIITFGKGISSSYFPLGGIIVSDSIISTLKEKGDGIFAHGYTFSGHPMGAAAGLAVLEYMEKYQVLKSVQEKGKFLEALLQDLKKKTSIIGDVRGRGLMWGIEIVKDQLTNEPFPPEYNAAQKINEKAIEAGGVFYPGSGAILGKKGDHLLIGPPLTITMEEIDEMVSILSNAFEMYVSKL